MFIGKLFNRFDVNFDIDKKITYLFGVNGAGKSQILNLLNTYFKKHGENVLYFPDNRKLDITSEEILSIMMAYRLQSKEKNVFSKYNIKYNLLDIKNNSTIIVSGFIQLVNFFCKIINGDKNLIVIIDEPERNLSVVFQKTLIDDIASFSNVKQIIIATHSPEIIGKNYDRCININNIVKLY